MMAEKRAVVAYKINAINRNGLFSRHTLYHRRRPTSPLHTRNGILLLSNEAGRIVLRHAEDAC
jgi:hypothetical protein